MSLLTDIESSPGNAHDANVLPLINVVFLLLMFFMMAGQLTRQSKVDALPESFSEQGISERTIRIEILSPDVVLVDAEPIADTLTEALRAFHHAIPQGEVVSEGDGGVGGSASTIGRDVLLVHVDRSLDVSVLDSVLRAMRELNHTELQIATRPSR